MADPLLSLTTLLECPSVQIDGTLYELTPPDALDLLSAVKLEMFQKKYYGLAQQLAAGDHSDVNLAETERAVDELVRIVLRAPATITDKLRIVQKLSVVFAFFALSPTGHARAAATPTLASRPTGASSRPGLRGSTAARRSSGSRPPRSRSSGRASR